MNDLTRGNAALGGAALALGLLLASAAAAEPPSQDRPQEPPQTIDQLDPEFWDATKGRVADLPADVYRAGARRLLAQARRAEARQALYLLQKARNLYPDDPRVLGEYARASLEPYRWTWDRDEAWVERAAKALERARGRAPDLPEVRRAAGLLMMVHGRLQPAERELRVALEQDPDDVETLLILGANLRLQDRFREAYDVFDRAIAADPADWRGYSGMADAYRDDRWYEEALNLYRKAQELGPRAFLPRFGKATVYQRTGFPTIANRLQVEMLRDYPEFSGLVLLSGASVHMQILKFDKALQELEQISFGGRRGLCDGSVAYRIGLCRLQLGDTEGAARELRRAIDEYPEARDGSDYGPLVLFAASRALADIYHEQGKPDEATALLEAASRHPEAPPSLQLHLSERYASYSLFDRAVEVLRRGIEAEEPGDRLDERVRLRVGLARALAASGGTDDGARLQEIAAEVHEKGTPVDHYLMARGFSLAGRRDLALEWLAQAVDRGYLHFDAIRAEPDLEPIRATRGYVDLLRGK